jgi:magnesium transporter
MNDLKRPWEQLQNLLEINDTNGIKSYVDSLNPDEIIRIISRLDRVEQNQLLTILSPEDAAEVVENIPDAQAVSIIENMNVSVAAAIVNEMQSDEQADILSELNDKDAAAIIDEMELEEAEDVRKLIQYDPDTAGGLMITEFLQYDESSSVDEVVKDLRANAEKYDNYNVQYVYVVASHSFIGVLRMKDLLMSKLLTRLSDIVIRDALTVNEHTKLEELISFFNSYDFYGVPVVNEENQLVGVVLRKHILEAETEKVNIDLLSTQGIVGGEELRTMPVIVRSRRRLSWLSINIILNIIAASVIAFYQETLSSVIALAVFLPIISDMSGCSGNQAVAVSMRELSLGVVKPFEVVRVWIQEIYIGIINGLVLGMLIGIAAYLWKGNVFLGLVVGGALTINTMVAVSLGGTLPLALKRIGFDPALASGPILTVIAPI